MRDSSRAQDGATRWPLNAMPKASKLRVAVLLSGREQFSSFYGGALARWTFEVYRRLQDVADVTVLGYPTRAEDLYPLRHYTSLAVPACALLGRVPYLRRFEDRLWLNSLGRRLRESDVVHVHNRPQWIEILRELGVRGRLVLHLQNDHIGHWAPTELDRLAEQVDVVVVCSGYLRSSFEARSEALAEKTQVIFNGVNTQLFCPREDLREARTILFVGRFAREKGVLELVRAFSRVGKSYPEAMVIVGTTGFGRHAETAYVKEVRAQAAEIAETRCGKVEFVGYIHHDSGLPGYFQRATVFCCPSLFQEPFGLVNAEAMACASPVVGSDRGGIPEVLGSTGVLINPEDTDALATVVGGLLGSCQERKRLGWEAYARCLRLFDWAVIAREWAGVLTGNPAAFCGCHGAQAITR
jgi:spore coat protein SA